MCPPVGQRVPCRPPVSRLPSTRPGVDLGSRSDLSQALPPPEPGQGGPAQPNLLLLEVFSPELETLLQVGDVGSWDRAVRPAVGPGS